MQYHVSCSTITYTVYIYICIYKYIHKYLTCTTNSEKRGKREPKRLMRTWVGGESINAHWEDSVCVFA